MSIYATIVLYHHYANSINLSWPCRLLFFPFFFGLLLVILITHGGGIFCRYDEHDLCKGLAATTSGLINPRSINYLPDDDFEAINDIRRPTAPLTMSQLDLTPDFTRGVGFGDTSIFNEADIVYGQRSGSHVPRILLEGDFSDLDGEFTFVLGLFVVSTLIVVIMCHAFHLHGVVTRSWTWHGAIVMTS